MVIKWHTYFYECHSFYQFRFLSVIDTHILQSQIGSQGLLEAL